jgi:hypothetical protein
MIDIAMDSDLNVVSIGLDSQYEYTLIALSRLSKMVPSGDRHYLISQITCHQQSPQMDPFMTFDFVKAITEHTPSHQSHNGHTFHP